MNTNKIINTLTYVILAAGIPSAGYLYIKNQESNFQNALIKNENQKLIQEQSSLNLELKLLRTKLDENEVELNKKRNEINELIIGREKNNLLISKYIKENNELINKLKSSKTVIDKLKNDIDDLIKQKNNLVESNNELELTKKLIAANEEIDSLNKNNLELVSRIENLKTNISENENSINAMTIALENGKNELISLTNENKKLRDNYEKAKDAIKVEASNLISELRNELKLVDDNISKPYDNSAKNVSTEGTIINQDIYNMGLTSIESNKEILDQFEKLGLDNESKIQLMLAEIIKASNQNFSSLYPIFSKTKVEKVNSEKFYHYIYFTTEASYDDKNALEILSFADTLKKMIEEAIPNNQKIILLPAGKQ